MKIGHDTDEMNGVGAYANSCIRDLNFNGRPVMGYAFINAAVVSVDPANF